MDIIKSIEHEQLKSKVPVLDIGNTVRVHVRVKEGNRERIQVFEGIIIKKQGGGLTETFTVRRISYGVGVEKTFLLHSPMVEKIEVVRVGKARRATKTKEKLGARIENKEIVVKEELEVPATEEVVEENVEAPVEEVKEVKAEAKATEKKEEAKTEKKVEAKAEKKEEAKKEEKAE